MGNQAGIIIRNVKNELFHSAKRLILNEVKGIECLLNIGNPGELTMLELAEKVISIIGSKSKIVYKPLPFDDPKKRRPNIELAKEKLNGWEPKINLEEGLKKTIKNFDEIVLK